MLWGGSTGGLELRRSADGATRLRGRFPYNVATVLWDGGRGGQARKETIAPRAFASRVGQPDAEIHLLIGHDFDRPLASRGAGSLRLEDGDEALTFEATLPAELRAAPYVADFLAAMDAGLIRGVSPGFRIAPVDGAEEVRTDGAGILRTVRAAELIEVSVVTRPAYPAAQLEARAWTPGAERPDAGLIRSFARWRA